MLDQHQISNACLHSEAFHMHLIINKNLSSNQSSYRAKSLPIGDPWITESKLWGPEHDKCLKTPDFKHILFLHLGIQSHCGDGVPSSGLLCS